jgi:PAS domain-containing protein
MAHCHGAGGRMRYFFHFLAGNERLDDDAGIEHAEVARARAEAVRAARELIAESLRRNLPIAEDGVIEITDARGQLVDQVSLVSAAFGDAGETAERHYRRIFDVAPQNLLLLTPDFTIRDANRAYLRATMTNPSAIVRRPLFDVFPDNPGDPDATGVRNVSASLNAVLRDKAEHTLPVQRYDLRRPDGAWEVRYWKPRNIPILDANGEVEFIVHQTEDVTRAVLGQRSRAD